MRGNNNNDRRRRRRRRRIQIIIIYTAIAVGLAFEQGIHVVTMEPSVFERFPPIPRTRMISQHVPNHYIEELRDIFADDFVTEISLHGSPLFVYTAD